MKLYAISDLHLSGQINHDALLNMRAYPDDWLILAGDIGETETDLFFALDTLCTRFARLIWVPGNHDLWTIPSDAKRLRGVEKYARLVEICRQYSVATPEDPFPVWPGSNGANGRLSKPGDPHGEGQSAIIAPVFGLYDYSFRPAHVSFDEALAWAAEAGISAADEMYLRPDPYETRDAWCEARIQYTEQRLSELPGDMPVVLVNHFPLRRDLAVLPSIPRFSLWCGTTLTEQWHTRYNVAVVVYGHLHIRGTYYRDGVRFEETSLGYSRHWNQAKGIDHYLRQIWPPPGQ